MKRAFLLWFAFSACSFHGMSAAQSYPSKAVRFIIPFAAGGSADMVARTLAPKLTENLGQQIVIENRGGASAIIGVEAGAKASPDGYTILLGGFSSHVLNFHLFRKLPYHPVNDFVAIMEMTRIPNVLSVHPVLPARSLQEFVAFAKARPGEVNYASSGSGSSQHLSGVLFQKLSGVKITHVPYRSGAPATADLLGGHVLSMFVTMPAGMPHVRSGKLRPLGVTSARRSPALPDVPAIAEMLPGFDIATYYSLHAPAGTPKEIINRLHSAFSRALLATDIRQRLESSGAMVVANTPEQFVAQLRQELAHWGPLVKEAGVQLD